MIDYDVLCQLVTIETEGGKPIVVSMEEIVAYSNKACHGVPNQVRDAVGTTCHKEGICG